MQESQHHAQRTWARTRGAWAVAQTESARACTVSTLRVKVIGSVPEARAESSTRRFDKTQSYGRVLPSFEDCIAVDEAVDEERNVYWDVTGLFEREEPAAQDVAFARTLPARAAQVGLDVSGVRARERMRLWLEPADRAAIAADPYQTQSDRFHALRAGASARARTSRLSTVRTVVVAFGTAAAICVMSLLAAQLLYP